MRVFLAVLLLLIAHEGTNAKPKPKPEPKPKPFVFPSMGIVGGHHGLGGDYGLIGAPQQAARQRPVIGLNQMSPRGDYSLKAPLPAARLRPVIGLNQMSPRGDYNGPLPFRPPAHPNVIPLNGQGADYGAFRSPKSSAGMDYSDYCHLSPCPGQSCFSGTSTVQSRRGVLSMEQLVLGDSVLTISRDKGLIYTEFLGWLDRSANANGLFLKISTNSSSIVLTGNHLIFRTSASDGSLESVFADQIEKGDKLVSWKGLKMTEETVVAVEPAVKKGKWSPFTMEGTLLVDGLLASCYASFPHAVSDLAFAPVVKLFPRMLLDDEESVKVDGVREVVKLAKKVLTAMGLRQRNHGEKTVPRNVSLSGNAAVAALAGSSKHIEF